jgi:hypothetical protein
MATPITQINLKDCALIAQAGGTGTPALNPYGKRMMLDMGNKIMLNGMIYSPDLSQCFGSIDDPVYASAVQRNGRTINDHLWIY